MNTRTRDFHTAVRRWYNTSKYVDSYGFADTIDQVTTGTHLCPELTCEWEQIILIGRTNSGPLRVVIANADIFAFLQQLGES